MTKLSFAILLLLLLTCCWRRSDHPVTRCISHGHKIDRCIELAKALDCERKND